MRRGDYLLLTGYCLLVCGFALWYDRTLTAHETVGCVNIREMRLDGDWIIPHYGGRPWLERPPLPFWLTMPCVALVGDTALAYRLAPLLVAIPCVLLVGWMAGLWFGRGVGLLAGGILATAREFTHYATGPEADMFVCGVVTTAMALFVYLEFRTRPAEGETGVFAGKRPWALLAFFVVLGLGNVTKGLFFADLFILLPIAVFLLWGTDRWAMIRRYFWLPGWLAFVVVGFTWALAAYLRYPDIVHLWGHDYGGRYNQGYMREPVWYYLVHLPIVLFPWTFVAFFGLALTWPRVREGRTPERFLWCWALVPVLFFSLPQGKHHHYMLHIVAPWSILSALGMIRVWQWLPTVAWLDRPWPLLVTVAIPGEVVLFVSGAPLGRLLPITMLLLPLFVFAFWWVLTRQDLRVAGIGLFALLVPLHWFGHGILPVVDDRFRGDLALLDQVHAKMPSKAPLLVLDTVAPLGASWFLYYLEGRAGLLHNPSFLLHDGTAEEVYVITRRGLIPACARHARTELIYESPRSQDERGEPAMRFGLYRMRLHTGVARHRGPVYISPMQATGREAGPELKPPARSVARQ